MVGGKHAQYDSGDEDAGLAPKSNAETAAAALAAWSKRRLWQGRARQARFLTWLSLGFGRLYAPKRSHSAAQRALRG